MIDVLVEIVVPLLIAFAVGVLIGWMLWRWRRTRVSVTAWNEITSLADANRAGIIDLRDEREKLGGRLQQMSGLLATTRGDLEASGAELERLSTLNLERQSAVDTLQDELGTAHRRIDELQTELSSSTERVAVLEAELRAEGARSGELERRLERSVGDGSTNAALRAAEAKVEMLESDMSTATRRVAELEGQLEALRPAASSPPAETRPAWVTGVTELGTFAAGHTDDLEVINGIGPKMEQILNGFGITAWEQIAALTTSEITRVSEAIDTFPGRIERDRWVEQAGDLVARFPDLGHRPARETFLNASADDDPWS